MDKDKILEFRKFKKQKKIVLATAIDVEKLKQLGESALAFLILAAGLISFVPLAERAIRIEDETRQVQMQDLIDKQRQSNAEDATLKEQKAVYGMTEDEMRAKGYDDDYIFQIQMEKELMKQNKPTTEDNFSGYTQRG